MPVAFAAEFDDGGGFTAAITRAHQEASRAALGVLRQPGADGQPSPMASLAALQQVCLDTIRVRSPLHFVSALDSHKSISHTLVTLAGREKRCHLSLRVSQGCYSWWYKLLTGHTVTNASYVVRSEYFLSDAW